MIEMVKLDDGDCVPRECCTFTNPLTSGGKSVVDDVELPCGADCENECSNCVIQKIMNEYATLENKLLAAEDFNCKHGRCYQKNQTRYLQSGVCRVPDERNRNYSGGTGRVRNHGKGGNN